MFALHAYNIQFSPTNLIQQSTCIEKSRMMHIQYLKATHISVSNSLMCIRVPWPQFTCLSHAQYTATPSTALTARVPQYSTSLTSIVPSIASLLYTRLRPKHHHTVRYISPPHTKQPTLLHHCSPQHEWRGMQPSSESQGLCGTTCVRRCNAVLPSAGTLEASGICILNTSDSVSFDEIV